MIDHQLAKSDSTFYGLWEYNQAVMAAQARALRLHRAVEVCPEADDRWVGPCPCNHPEWHWLICQECCTRAGDQTEECATSHDHGPAKPRCATATALDISHQGDDQDWCRWENCDDATPSESA